MEITKINARQKQRRHVDCGYLRERTVEFMAFCEKCGAQIPENGTFCAACGAPVAAQAQPPGSRSSRQHSRRHPSSSPSRRFTRSSPVYQQPVYPQQPAYDPADHTAEFDPEDVSQNKVIAMAAYILGTVGIIIALLAAPQSKYAAFHSRQALKLDIVSTLLLIVSAVLAFTFIVPIAGAVCIAILFVVRIICFFQVCSGKAKDAAIIGKLPFLK